MNVPLQFRTQCVDIFIPLWRVRQSIATIYYILRFLASSSL